MLTPYWFPTRGGVTTFVAGLSEELRRSAALEVRVFARQGGPEGATVLGGGARDFIPAAVRELEAWGPDVVHAHGHWYTLRAALRYRRRHPAVRVVFTVHTELAPKSRLERLYLRRLLSRADYVTAVSQDLLSRTLRTFRPRSRTRVTPPGVSMPPPEPGRVAAFLREAGIAGARPLVVFVGPLAYERKGRGVERLLEAMAIVRRSHPEAVVAVAGEGAQRPRLEAFAERTLPGGARFLGEIPEPSFLLAAADVVAHISFQEGLPLAVLEAMALGRPIVATSVGGIPEVIRDGENGVLVSGDAAEIARRLLELLKDPERASHLGTRAREDAADLLSWAASARRFLPLYGLGVRKRVVVSVDLEKDYPVERGSYRGVEEALPKLLDLFERHGIVAEFFATADLAVSHPQALREILRRGHRLGCHGESHDVPYLSAKPPRWQYDTVRRATEALERCTGVRPSGFRAPNFSTDGGTIRALERLGYAYDSSVLPGRVVRRKRTWRILDHLAAPRDPYRPSRADPSRPGPSALVEFPVTENPGASGGPIGLGFLHARGAEATFEAVARSAGDPCVFLIHPWELLEPPGGSAPGWMREACSPDPARLDAFLAGLRERHELTTFGEELRSLALPEDWRQGDEASGGPAPVLLLVTNVYAPVIGGITSYVTALADAARRRADVRILAYPTLLVLHEAAHRRRLFRVFLHGFFAGIVFLAAAGHRLRGRKVLVHSQSANFCLFAAYLGSVVGARAVHTVHSPLGSRSRTHEWLSPRLDALVFVSPALREQYRASTEAWNEREAILPGAVAIPPAPDREAARRWLEARFGIPPTANLALFAGRVVREKGVHVLARAAALSGADGVHFAVAGPPGLRPEDLAYPSQLQELAGPASGRFRILGEVPREDLERLLAACDEFVVPSVWPEPAPMAAVEAMALGRPVIASDTGGLPFLVPDGVAGLLVPPEDPEALASAIRRLVRDSALRERLSRGARARAEERHSLERFGVDYGRLYSSL